ncbi:MAG: hypothetical protein PVG91_10175, partial [Gammaproteobacteria bacterium]
MSKAGWLAWLALISAPFGADAAWLALCDMGERPPDARPLREYADPDGHHRHLLISAARPEGCEAVQIAAEPDDIRWAGLIAPRDASGIDSGVSLLGEETGEEIRISEIIPASPGPADVDRPPTAPFGQNLLRHHRARVFGTEGRARVSVEGDELELECTAGEAPAGLLLRSDEYRLDRNARLRVRIEFAGAGQFGLGFSDAEDMRREAPTMLGELTAGADVDDQTFPLPDSISPGHHAFSVLCPGGAARMRLLGLELQPAPDLVPPARATWVWQAETWIEAPAVLLEQLERMGADTVFIAVPLGGDPLAVTEPARLAQFIDDALHRRISVWVVEGDPRAVLPDGERHMAARGRALAAFNERLPPERRLAGVQYDIEPYLLPGFNLDTGRWLDRYLDTLRTLRRTVAMPMEVAIPFWWSGLMAADGPLLERLAGVVDGITVMNYRTDEDQILDGAGPFLAWGADHQRYVRIALEAGPIPEQTRWHFRPFKRGRLWRVDMGGSPVLIL